MMTQITKVAESQAHRSSMKVSIRILLKIILTRSNNKLIKVKISWIIIMLPHHQLDMVLITLLTRMSYEKVDNIFLQETME